MVRHVVGVDKYHGGILVDSAGLAGVGAVRGISCNTHTHISHVVGVDKYHGRILVDSAGLTGVGAVRGISCNTSVK